jgi:hypothetical protein
VEQATFALGMKRYGLDDHAERLISAMFEASERFPDARLPEAITGHDRLEFAAPIAYPDANSPQAWSSSALIQMIQILLGIYPFAPLNFLAVIRPRLPEWLPQVTVRQIRVGHSSVDLRFTRRRDGTADHEVMRRKGPLLVVSAGPPDAVDGFAWSEQWKRAALEWMPGRRATAARIAFGRIKM